MNYKIMSKVAARFFMIFACVLSMQSYAMHNAVSVIDLNQECQTVKDFKTVLNKGNEVADQEKDNAFFSLDSYFKGEKKKAVSLAQFALNQKKDDRLAQHQLGLHFLRGYDDASDINLDKAYTFLHQSYEKDTSWHLKLMANAGIEGNKGNTFLDMYQQIVLRNERVPYALARMAQLNGDSRAERLCLQIATQCFNGWQSAAWYDLGAFFEQEKNISKAIEYYTTARLCRQHYSNQRYPLAELNIYWLSANLGNIRERCKLAHTFLEGDLDGVSLADIPFSSNKPFLNWYENGYDQYNAVLNAYKKAFSLDEKKKILDLLEASGSYASLQKKTDDRAQALVAQTEACKAEYLTLSMSESESLAPLVPMIINRESPQNPVSPTKNLPDSMAKQILSPLSSLSQELTVDTSSVTVEEKKYKNHSRHALLKKKQDLETQLARNPGDVESVRKEFIDVCEALLDAGNIDNSQRIALWKEMADKNHSKSKLELGIYYLDHAHNDTSRMTDGWTLLAKAAEDDCPGAPYEFMARGFKSNDNNQKASSAQYADRLFVDDLRMAQLKLDNTQKGRLYSMRARYALEKADEKTAREYFKKASECGNHDDAKVCAHLYFKHNDLSEARTQYGLVAGHDLSEARWKTMLLEYALEKKSGEQDKTILLQEIVKPLCGEAFYGSILTDAQIAEYLGHPKVFKQLQEHAEAGNAKANYILGFCAFKGWGLDGGKADCKKALDYYAKAANDDTLKTACVQEIMVVEENLKPQKLVDKLYKMIKEDDTLLFLKALTDCTPEATAILRRDAEQGSNIAKYMYGFKAFLADSKKRTFLGAQEVANSLRQEKESECFAVNKLKMQTIYLFSFLLENQAEKNKCTTAAADMGWGPAIYALHNECNQRAKEFKEKNDEKKSADFLKKADEYLKQAIEKDFFPAKVEDAGKKTLNKESYEEGCKIINNLLEKDLSGKDKGALSHLYELKAGMCHDEGKPEDCIEWWRKAVDAGSLSGAPFLLRVDIENENYQSVSDLLDKMNKPDYAKLVEITKAFIAYQSDNKESEASKNFKQLYCECLRNIESQDNMVREFCAIVMNKLDLNVLGDDTESVRIKALTKWYQGYPKEALKLEEKPKSYRLQSPLVFGNKRVDSEKQKLFNAMVQEAFEAKDKDFQHRAALSIKDVLMNTRDRGLSGFSLNEDVINCLITIAEGIGEHSEVLTDQERKEIEEAMAWSIAVFALYKKNIPMLNKWYRKMSDLDPNKMYMQAMLYEHNVDQEDKDKTGFMAVEAYRVASSQGDGLAVARYFEIYARGAVFPSGYRVEKSISAAAKAAPLLIDTELISPHIKALAFYVLAEQKQNDIILAQEKKQKDKVKISELCDEGIEYAQTSLNMGCHEALVSLMALKIMKSKQDEVNKTSYLDSVQTLFNAYKDRKEIWQTVGLSADFSLQSYVFDQKNLFIILKNLMTYLDGASCENPQGDLAKLHVMKDILADQSKNIKDKKAKAEEYGFENEKQYTVIANIVDAKIKEKTKQVDPDGSLRSRTSIVKQAVPDTISQDEQKYSKNDFDNFFAESHKIENVQEMRDVAYKAFAHDTKYAKKIGLKLHQILENPIKISAEMGQNSQMAAGKGIQSVDELHTFIFNQALKNPREHGFTDAKEVKTLEMASSKLITKRKFEVNNAIIAICREKIMKAKWISKNQK